jgi:hypothetical protein
MWLWKRLPPKDLKLVYSLQIKSHKQKPLGDNIQTKYWLSSEFEKGIKGN